MGLRVKPFLPRNSFDVVRGAFLISLLEGFYDYGSNSHVSRILRSYNETQLFLKHSLLSYTVALQSLKDLVRLTYTRFLRLFRQTVGLLGRMISPSQGLYLHRTTQHRKTETNIHALSGIRTHDPSVRTIRAHAPDCAATVTGLKHSSKINSGE
jgi:hypothetical protein